MSLVSTVPRRAAREERVARWREWIARTFTRVEDVVYVGLGLLALLRRRPDRAVADRAT